MYLCISALWFIWFSDDDIDNYSSSSSSCFLWQEKRIMSFTRTAVDANNGLYVTLDFSLQYVIRWSRIFRNFASMTPWVADSNAAKFFLLSSPDILEFLCSWLEFFKVSGIVSLEIDWIMWVVLVLSLEYILFIFRLILYYSDGTWSVPNTFSWLAIMVSFLAISFKLDNEYELEWAYSSGNCGRNRFGRWVMTFNKSTNNVYF